MTKRHLKFSQDLEFLLKRLVNQPLNLEKILAETSERGFSLIIGLLALPFLFPMPPGLSAIFGLCSLFLSIQMGLGRSSPWLPKILTRWKLPHQFSLILLNNLKRVTKFLEKIVRPRLPEIAENIYICRINGLCMAWLTLLLMLPIPLTNPFPAIAILLLAVANLEEDGLLMCVGYGLTIINTLFFAFIIHTIYHASDLLPSIFK